MVVDLMKGGAVDYLVKSDIDTEKLERAIRYSIERARSIKAIKANERKFRNIFERSHMWRTIANPDLPL